jgi:L-ascorbate metabolism protein UlaG (beta-lactamase superfamily)
MAGLGPLDVALLPVWGWGPSLGAGHLDPEGAARAAALLAPRVAVPIHWGTFARIDLLREDPLPPTRAFAEAVARLAPGVDVRVLAPGERLEL